MPEIELGTGGKSSFRYIRNFLDGDHASSLLDTFHKELNWQQYDIRLFGRMIPQPRLSCWYGDACSHYSYSGLHLPPMPWHPALQDLREQLQESLHCPFNSVLANAYRDGRDSMGWHADDEKELGAEPLIASVSLGASRRFLIKSKTGSETHDLLLEHGSLLVMQGQSQRAYMHSLPKTKTPIGLRINLTFRQIINP